MPRAEIHLKSIAEISIVTLALMKRVGWGKILSDIKHTYVRTLLIASMLMCVCTHFAPACPKLGIHNPIFMSEVIE